MARKSQGICPIAAAALIRREAKRQGISLNRAIVQQSRELDVPVETIREWVWPSKKCPRPAPPFWDKILRQLAAVEKVLKVNGASHPLDDGTRAELKARVRYLGEFIVRHELEAGKAYLPVPLEPKKEIRELGDAQCLSHG